MKLQFKNDKQISQLTCPSFETSRWGKRAAKIRPASLDRYIDLGESQKPVPTNHKYVRLYLRFLDSIPEECWIDEENEVD